ncbi:tail assembly chaperone [Lapidilactobacillus bayanensis]|uniref:tail assembly chaperone n=1 Tax=Lapidilactobacillus bayanensis TaxID=2485998 RepID=UPI000F7AD59A|nr:tail assembly chaperone [Lapidilactobacillus bayanensis]
MKITLNGKEYQLYFGVRFIRELDKKYWFGEASVPFGAGLENAWYKLQAGDLVILNDVIAAALATQITFTDGDFDNYFETLTDKNVTDMCDELVKNLERQPMTKKRVLTYKKNLAALANPDEAAEEKAPKKPTKK